MIFAEAGSSDLPFWGGQATDSYYILFVIHILAIVAAFGPLMLSSVINREATKRNGETAKAFASIPLHAIRKVSFPAFVVATLAGIGLVLDSEKAFRFNQTWISLAFSLVLMLSLVYWFLLIPAQKRLAEAVGAKEESAGDASVAQKVRSARASTAMATGLLHLGMVALVVIMAWKPGY